MAWTAELEHNTTGQHSTEPRAAKWLKFGWICSCETVNIWGGGGGVIPGDVSGHSPGLGTEGQWGQRDKCNQNRLKIVFTIMIFL